MNLALQAAATVQRWKWAGALACCGVLLGLTLGGPQAAAQVRPSHPRLERCRSL